MPILNPRHRPEIENLPPKYKWEVLRRHPHYIRDWQLANLFWQTPPDSSCRNDEDWPHLEAAACRIQQLTGWWDRVYPDPAKATEEIGGGFLEKLAGRENATPLTARSAIESVIWRLPPELLREVGRILSGDGIDQSQSFVEFSSPDGRNLTHQYLQTQALTRIRAARLDTELSGQLMVNLNAPLRGIAQEVSAIIKTEKDRRGLTEKRRRPDTIDNYLQVWDLREGWCKGKYDGWQEQPLRLVAQRVRRPQKTVETQYRQAFGLIVGTDYSPQEWLLIIARHKRPYSKYKGWRTAKPRQPVKMVFSEGTVTEASAADDGQAEADLEDLLLKVKELGGKDVLPTEIARRLEIEMHFNLSALDAEEFVKHILANDLKL